MKKSEQTLLFITVSVALSALFYVYVLEPGIKTISFFDNTGNRNKRFMEILERGDKIDEEYKKIFGSGYWKDSPQEQATSFQILIEKLAKDSGTAKVKSILPVPANKTGDNDLTEIPVQIDVECGINTLSRLLYNISKSDTPMRVNRLQVNGETGTPGTLRAQIEIATIWLKIEPPR
jgi:hypothetical protein